MFTKCNKMFTNFTKMFIKKRKESHVSQGQIRVGGGLYLTITAA